MKQFAVIGAGRFGEATALTLTNLGHEVIVIDKDEDIINKLATQVTYAVVADVRNVSVLEEVGLHNVDSAVVSMGSDLESSVLAVMKLKDLGIDHVIAKAKSPLHSEILSKVGADEVIIPEYDMGRKMAHRLATENIVEFYNVEGDYSILETMAPKKWVGRNLAQLDLRKVYNVNLLGITRPGKGFIGNLEPTIDIKAEDKLVLFGLDKDFSEIRKMKEQDAKK